MNKKLAIPLAVAVLAVPIGLGVWDLADPPETRFIDASYAFNVEDPEQLAGFSDIIAAVEVTNAGTSARMGEGVYTDYTVRVVRYLKGSGDPEFTVRQNGGKDGEDTVLFEDQPLLRQGDTYVLVLSTEPDRPQLTVVGGPISARPLPGTAGQRSEVFAAWTRAISRQVYPPDLR